MKSKIIEELGSHKSIVSVESFDLYNKLDFSSEERRQLAQKEIKKVELYRIAYKVDNLVVIGYVSLPANQKNKIPCIIHLRGGFGDFGALTPRTIYGQLVKFALEGFVVISTQYPGVDGGEGYDGFGNEVDIESITKLRDILKGISVANTTMIGVKGHSRGGLMLYMLLREVKWIRAAVILSAPTDPSRIQGRRPNRKIVDLLKNDNEMLRRSPLRWVSELPKKVPILLMHGSADSRVSPLDSIEMSRELFKNKIPHRFILFEGSDHGITEFKSEHRKQTLDWFHRFLPSDRTLPNLRPHGD